ncbi:hypothetical protein IEO21_09170 [Rhodonia placenta]|uniref:CDC20/Fizzy WD40 domain-containing protein n=1 Tax=Rhodonia placenta TaxID=104341 RepID=A0A8H7TYH5_9APHY|nr:hypothetical protein IEO21_09170 [Postia placenta]
MTLDFTVTDAETDVHSAPPVSWSMSNILVFGRGNRVHYRNMAATGDDVRQLCKIRDEHGNLRLVQCASGLMENMVAVCTSTGHIQVWDLVSNKMTAHWSTKGVTAMQWNGQSLTVGGIRGTIRHYDTRIKETAKMKEQSRKTTRHQAVINSLSWNSDGKFLASGDESGTVHVWDSRQNAPLDVGDLIQRRRKMQHEGAVHALAWCPWQSGVLASGDSAQDNTGTIRIWNVNSSPHPTSTNPTKLELDAQITSLHFSTHCKELLSTHGLGKSTTSPPPNVHLDSMIFPFPSQPRPARFSNSVAVHRFPSLNQVCLVQAAQASVAGSVLSPNGQRIVLAVPGESKLKVWDVWGRKRELRRTSSILSGAGIR